MTREQGASDPCCDGEMFAPPVNRAMKVLDRAFFTKTVPSSAARIFNTRDIAPCRAALDKSRDALINNRLHVIRPDPDEERAQKGGKCILLRPDVMPTGKPGRCTCDEKC